MYMYVMGSPLLRRGLFCSPLTMQTSSFEAGEGMYMQIQMLVNGYIPMHTIQLQFRILKFRILEELLSLHQSQLLVTVGNYKKNCQRKQNFLFLHLFLLIHNSQQTVMMCQNRIYLAPHKMNKQPFWALTVLYLCMYKIKIIKTTIAIPSLS